MRKYEQCFAHPLRPIFNICRPHCKKMAVSCADKSAELPPDLVSRCIQKPCYLHALLAMPHCKGCPAYAPERAARLLAIVSIQGCPACAPGR